MVIQFNTKLARLVTFVYLIIQQAQTNLLSCIFQQAYASSILTYAGAAVKLSDTQLTDLNTYATYTMFIDAFSNLINVLI